MLFSKKIVNASLAAVLLSLGANAMDQGQGQQDVAQRCEMPCLKAPKQQGISVSAKRLRHQTTFRWDNAATFIATTTKECDFAFSQAAKQKGRFKGGQTPLVDKPCFNEIEQNGQAGQAGRAAQGKCAFGPEITAIATLPGHVAGSLNVEGNLSGTANFEELVVETLTRTNADGSFTDHLPNGPKSISVDQFFGALAPEWADVGAWNTDFVQGLTNELLRRLTGSGTEVTWAWTQDCDGAMQVTVSDAQEPGNVVTIAPQAAPAAQGKKPAVVVRRH
jgi:hypothetical protein